MPHVNDLSLALRTALLRMDVAELRPILTFFGKAKVAIGQDAGGFPIFSAGYSQVTVDISDRAKLNEIVSITQEKPIFPDDGGNGLISSGLSIPLVNTDSHLAAIQTEAIIDPESIEGGTVKVRCGIGSQFLNLFTGRITGLPGENFGDTVLEILDNLFDTFSELRYEDFGQNSFVQNGQLISNGFEIIQNGGYIKFHDGYLFFAEDGSLYTTFENNKPEIIDLLDVRLKSGARLGEYTIEFQSSGGYRVSFPDSSFMQGDVQSVFDSPYLRIEPQFWQIAAGQSNFNGTKITFQCRYVIEANPFTLIKNLIEKTFLRNFGDIPSDTSLPGFAGAVLPVLWDTLDELENRFRLARVFVSVGNDDNKVFEKKPNGKPLNGITLAQQVADHCVSNLLIDTNGEMRAQGPQMFDTPIHDLNDAHHIKEFSLIGLIKDNFATFNYASNDKTGSYAKKIEFDLRALPETPIQEVTINFPFYKIGHSENHAAYFARLFKNKIKRGHTRARMLVMPQFGISLIPGDRIRIVTSKRPVITSYFEIYRINKSCSFDSVELELIQIQNPEGAELTPCTYSFCADGLCG